MQVGAFLTGSYLTTIALAVERLNAMRSPGGSPSANPLLHGGCYPMRKGRKDGGIRYRILVFYEPFAKKNNFGRKSCLTLIYRCVKKVEA